MGCKMTHCAADLDLPSSQFSLQLEHLRMREAAGCVFQCGNDLHVQPIRTSFSTRKKMTMLEKCTQFSGEKKNRSTTRSDHFITASTTFHCHPPPHCKALHIRGEKPRRQGEILEPRHLWNFRHCRSASSGTSLASASLCPFWKGPVNDKSKSRNLKKNQDQHQRKNWFPFKNHQQPIFSEGFPPSQRHPAAFISQPASMPSMGRSGGRLGCPWANLTERQHGYKLLAICTVPQKNRHKQTV